MWSIFTSVWVVLRRTFKKPATVQYPEVRPQISPRFRGRIVLTRDPDGEERCVACYLCSSACPVDCIVIDGAEDERGRRYPRSFRINFSRCIYCGMCEEACPTLAIQLTPDFEMAEYKRHNMVYEKSDLLIAGTGKYEGYNFYRMAGLAISGKDKGQAVGEKAPLDTHSLMP